MQAIITKRLPCTNTKPFRIKATCARGSLTICEDSSSESSHCYAANRLCESFVTEDVLKYRSDPLTNPWAKKRVSGCLPSGEFVHVFA